MGPLTSTLAALIPEGPLHPELAVTGAVAGLALASVAGRHGLRWVLLVVVGALLLAERTQGEVLVDGFGDRPDRVAVVAITGLIVAALCAARLRWSSAFVASIAGCLVTWAVVPDTEVALLTGFVLAGAGALRVLPGWIPDTRSRANGLLVLLPLVAAAAGSSGRPSRYPLALLFGMAFAVLALTVRTLLVRTLIIRPCRQRAGTPITVAPGATSSTTTAPAATTAF